MMKNIQFSMRLLIGIVAVLMLAGLSALPSNAEVTSINGAAVFNNNCARCHNARSLDEFSLNEWAVIMPHMREKAHLTGQETEAVMQFIRLVKNGDEAPRETKSSAMNGEALFKKYSCQGCHSLNGKGGTVGPALDSIIENKGRSFFVKKLQDPQFNNPSSPMPKMPLTNSEIDALVKFLFQKNVKE